MVLLSGGEIRLPLLRVSGGVRGADRSLQQAAVLRLFTAQREDTCLWEGKWYRKKPRIGSENSGFQALVCARQRDRTEIRQTILGSAERTAPVVIDADCNKQKK